MAQAIYQEHPLLSPNSIRLLEILPAVISDRHDIIACHLKIRSLDRVPAPSYRAVSYVWGDPSVTKRILVDGQPFDVRMNLWTFLFQMRLRQQSDLLWIDALCINQSDIKERGHQVAVMGQIFAKAFEVQVWLGPHDDPTSLAMHRLAEADWDAVSKRVARQQPWISGVLRRFQTRVDLAVMSRKYLAPILGLLNSIYWTRLWVVQEFVLARKIAVHCGHDSVAGITLEHFYKAIRVAKLRNLPGTTDVCFAKMLTSMGARILETRLRYSLQVGRRDTTLDTYAGFARLISIFRESQCQDPYDHVFALLSLNESARQNITPDYTISVLQLFLEVTAQFRTGFDVNDIGNQEEWIRGAVEDLAEVLNLSIRNEQVKETLLYFRGRPTAEAERHIQYRTAAEEELVYQRHLQGKQGWSPRLSTKETARPYDPPLTPRARRDSDSAPLSQSWSHARLSYRSDPNVDVSPKRPDSPTIVIDTMLEALNHT
jgi:hypothetical protein